MKILVANIGSTSFKWKLFGFEGEDVSLLHQGALERVVDYGQAIDYAFLELEKKGVIATGSDLNAIGFKVVHALNHTGCVILNEEVLQDMEQASCLAPAHNPPYINGIRKIKEKFPTIPLIGLFETAFYQWMPSWSRFYAVPWEWTLKGLKRWGFHGASHKYIAERVAQLHGREDILRRLLDLYTLGPGSEPEGEPLKLISCHLGGSSSITASRNGIAIGNSMGLTPQSGLPQNNRVGDIDVFALPFIIKTLNLSLEEALQSLTKRSGLLGISGISNDMRDIISAAKAGNERAKIAIDVFVHEVRRWIGSYLVELGGLDALAFSGGIGENQPEIRELICSGLDVFGLKIDLSRNLSTVKREGLISKDDSKVKVWVIPTNEELIVAREVKRFLEIQNRRK